MMSVRFGGQVEARSHLVHMAQAAVDRAVAFDKKDTDAILHSIGRFNAFATSAGIDGGIADVLIDTHESLLLSMTSMTAAKQHQSILDVFQSPQFKALNNFFKAATIHDFFLELGQKIQTFQPIQYDAIKQANRLDTIKAYLAEKLNVTL